jgi:Fe2+ transport system protein B
LGGRKLLGNIAYFSIFVLFSILAANQAGINTDIITTNLALILGAFLASVALAMGLGSRDIVFRLILGFYSRKNYAIGTLVKIDDFEGRITAIDNICMTVENHDKKIIYPIELVVNSKVEIVKN